MWLRGWLIAIVACHHEPAPSTITNRIPPPAPVDAPPPPTPCERYDAMVDKARACTVLSKDVRDRIEQERVDTHASIAESGLDGGERVDPDEACEAELAKLETLAAQPCGW